MAEGVAIHEIGHAADGLAENNGRSDEVSKCPRINVEAPCIPITGNCPEQQAALNGHAALPDKGDFPYVIVIIGPVKEQYVPKTAADDAGQAAAQGKVKNMYMPAPAVPLGDIICRNAGRNDAEHK